MTWSGWPHNGFDLLLPGLAIISLVVRLVHNKPTRNWLGTALTLAWLGAIFFIGGWRQGQILPAAFGATALGLGAFVLLGMAYHFAPSKVRRVMVPLAAVIVAGTLIAESGMILFAIRQMWRGLTG